MSRARCVGNLVVGEKFCREGDTKTGIPYKSINIGVKANNSTIFAEAFGMRQNTIKTMDADNKAIEIDYADRNDEDVIKSVASYRKHVVKIDGERHEFISDYDFVEYLIENIDELKNKKLIVTASSSPNVYEGKVSTRYQIQNVYEANEDEKESIKVTTDFYFNKDSLDVADFKDDKKIYLNGYVQEYFNKNDLGTDKGANRYVAQQIVLDCSKLDFENERHMKLLDFKLKMLGLKRDDMKITSKLKKGWYALGIECNYLNGAEMLDFTEDMLTDNQKEMLALGLKTLEDFRPKDGSIYGAKVTQFKLVNFSTSSKYADGMIETDDIEDLIFSPAASTESLDLLDEDKGKEFMEFEDDTEDLFD